MKTRTKLVIAGAAVVAAAAAGTGMAGAGGAGDTDVPIPPGTDLDRASTAALAHTGGGRVTGTEVGDEESYYEVEVTLADGHQVDVQLDHAFKVVGDKVDRESSGDTGG